MIILDTHVWVWWADVNPLLTAPYKKIIQQHQNQGLGVSHFSLWEVAKLVEKKRVSFSVTLEDRFDKATTLPNIVLLPATPAILVESIQLPQGFHKDPADQVIVATARVNDCPLVTYDSKILSYRNQVKLLP